MGEKRMQRQQMCDESAKANIVKEDSQRNEENPEPCPLQIKLEGVDDLKRAIIYSEIINRKY